jgi:3-oxoacyl-[acyl-carrier protein] reductase
MRSPRVALVLGARNLGSAIAEDLTAHGWSVACVARSDASLDRARSAGALAIRADASDPDAFDDAIGTAQEALGAVSLIVNAVTASRPAPGDAWGGGPIIDGSLAQLRGWCVPVAEQALVFLSVGARRLRATGGGTLVQVTGGSARRALPSRGMWAAGAAATRALTHAAAQELRGQGIHVALLIVDATIESEKTTGRAGVSDAMIEMSDVAHAVRFIADQKPRGLTHELVVTPAQERWVP